MKKYTIVSFLDINGALIKKEVGSYTSRRKALSHLQYFVEQEKERRQSPSCNHVSYEVRTASPPSTPPSWFVVSYMQVLTDYVVSSGDTDILNWFQDEAKEIMVSAIDSGKCVEKADEVLGQAAAWVWDRPAAARALLMNIPFRVGR